jgi:predicted ferric reductase
MVNVTRWTWFNPYPGMPGPLTPFELVSLLLIWVIPIVFVLVSAKTDSGRATQFMVFFTILLALKTNFLEYLFGVSWERAILFHKTFGIVSFVCACLHGLPQITGFSGSEIMFGIVSFVCACLHGLPQITGFSGSEIMADTKFRSGLINLCVLGMQPILYLIVKPVSFELFYYTHLALYGVLIYFAIVHQALFVAWAAIALGVDLAVRFLLRTHRVAATIESKGGDIVQVSFAKKFSYRPGQYVFLMIPALGVHEFHPLSLSSAPHESRVTLHASVQGGWTRRLNQLAASNGGAPLQKTVLVQGPYGILSLNLEDSTYKIVVLISGGSGVTPHQSIANHLLHCHAQGRPLKKLVYVWVLPESRVAFMTSTMKDGQFPQVRNDKSPTPTPGAAATPIKDNKTEPATLLEGTSVLYTTIYCTGRTRSVQPTDYALVLPVETTESAAAQNVSALHKGKPDFNQLLRQVKELALAQGECRVAVSVCGPNAMIGGVVDVCRALTSKEVQFDLHVERFQL